MLMLQSFLKLLKALVTFCGKGHDQRHCINAILVFPYRLTHGCYRHPLQQTVCLEVTVFCHLLGSGQ